MKRMHVLVVMALLVCTGCPKPARTQDESMLNFLPYLNEKVVGYLDMNPGTVVDQQSYRKIVDNVCGALPSCGPTATNMFNTYSVHARNLDGMFSVMLCDKEDKQKIMEDFSCNGLKVELPPTNKKEACQFEDRWKELIVADCPRLK